MSSRSTTVTHFFQFGFADTRRYWHPSWLITLTFFRTGNKHFLVWVVSLSSMEEAYVDTIIWYYQEVSRWFDEDLVSEVVFWFDVAHVPDHSQSYPAWSGGEQSNMCFEVPMKRDLMAFVRAQEEALDFERLQLRWQLRLTAGVRSADMHRSLFPCVVLTQWCAVSEYSRRAVLPSGRERSRTCRTGHVGHTAKVQMTLFRPLRVCYGRERLCLATWRTRFACDYISCSLLVLVLLCSLLSMTPSALWNLSRRLEPSSG